MVEFFSNLFEQLVLSIVFTVVGVALFGGCLYLVVRLSPFSIRKEIEEDQNTALGIIIGAMILGIAIILAAAIIDISPPTVEPMGIEPSPSGAAPTATP